MVVIIVRITYITCLAISDAWHMYGASGSIRYMSELVESYKSRNRQTVVGWSVMGEVGVAKLTELTILWLASTVMGEVGAHNRGGMPPGQKAKAVGRKKYCID